jgi:beta-glucanase (GH16 family)
MSRLCLPVGAAPTTWFSDSAPGTTLYATSVNAQLAANASDITLVSEGDDDTFIVYDPSDVVVEVPNSGVSTIETWGSGYTLPAYVQNLTLMGSADAYAVGNSLNNIITANTGDDSIIAGTGNDILVGGSGDDTFVINSSDGEDEIQHFRPGANSGDVVQLSGFSFSSFADIQAAMTQVGPDTVLNLGNGQSITFDNTTVSSFDASNFDLPFNPAAAGMTMTFDDEFNTLNLNYGSQSGTWSTEFPWGGRTLPNNNELEEYMDPAYAGSGTQPLGVDPFSGNNGVLTITAQPTSPSVAPYINNMPYTSGLLTSYGSFAQTYGYWEIGAQIPQGDGLLPAFWLLPESQAYPPEVDIMETLGSDPSTVYNSFHGDGGVDYSQATHTGDLSTGFHTFGFDWTPSTMTWYVDGQPTYQLATPAYMDQPMYMLIDLAVGGNWPGSPDATTQFPANFNIDFVRVYSDPFAAPDPSDTGTTAADPTVPSDYQSLSVASGSNIVNATGNYDTVTGGSGTDTITGNGWGDVIIAGSGTETVSLSAGDGAVDQGSGQDTIILSGNNDTVYAGVQGNGLNEALMSTQGNWFTFVDGAAPYADTVVGFDPAQGDSMHLTGKDTQSYALAHATQVNGGQDTLISMSDGSTILLRGVSQIDGSFFS